MASLTLLTSCLAALASCSHSVEAGSPVPAATPDTLPHWIYDHETSDSPVLSGTFLTNILTVVFESGTPRRERQEAVDSVNGEVVGGQRLFGDEGYYYVFVADDHPETPGQALVDAMELLDSLPQVAGASPVQIFPPEGLRLGKPSGETGWQVPELPPDSVPSGALADSIFAPENRISDPRLGSRVPRDIVFLSFVPDATQEQRQEAIDLVGGRVVGGVPVHPGAWYIVRIPSDGTAEPLVQAIRALEGLPTVRAATPHPTGVVPAYRRPDGVAVPAVAPDTVPSGFYDTENVRTGSACVSGRMLRGIVVVTFNEGTAQADKQAAIDLIDGEVVGGILPGDGKEVSAYRPLVRFLPVRPDRPAPGRRVLPRESRLDPSTCFTVEWAPSRLEITRLFPPFWRTSCPTYPPFVRISTLPSSRRRPGGGT